MRPAVVAVLFIAACSGGEPESTLSIDGPVRVRVETLGPVDGPRFVLSDGTAPEGLVVEVGPSHVARVKGADVVAVGRGEAVVTGRWGLQVATWELVVEPAVALAFDDPPLLLAVGASAPLKVKASIGGEPAIPVDLAWAVEPEGIVELRPGTVVALSPGTAWITARHGASEAMLEVEVVAELPPTP
jgi:hypothetical protein